MADIIVVPADVLVYDGAASNVGIAGEAITAGETLFLHTDGALYLALCDTALHAAAKGVALNNADPDQPVSYVTGGGLNPGVAVVVGTVYGVTDTAGGISGIVDRGATDYMTVLGVATTTSRIELRIWASGYKLA